MNIQEYVDLSEYSTMALGGVASFLTHATNKDELIEAYSFARSKELPCLVMGSGSNIIWRDEGFKGLVIVSDIMQFDINWQNDHEALITIGSGEEWDYVVERCVSEGFTGIESLSLIPGKAGATPVQNVGAYGQEIADTLVRLVAYDPQANDLVTIENKDCNFGYRTSRFKTRDHGRYFIVNITLHLTKANPSPPFYSALTRYLEEHHINEYTPKVIRDSVIDIRSQKLPDPKKVHNNGSFFSNPIISTDKYIELHKAYPDMPNWPAGEGMVKVSAAWLIDKVGFKDYHDDQTGMATWVNQPLVLVNEHARSTMDLITFRDRINTEVNSKFGIILTQEPEILPIS